MTVITKEIETYWAALSSIFIIRNEQEYDQAIERLNELVDKVGMHESHPLYDMLDTLGAVIHAYEERLYPMPESSGADMLRFLMDEHGLRQSDLPEVGSQGVVSEVLGGKRELNIRQIQALAARFHVSPAVFF
ncbi:MAG: transcriptional regulator [Chloroflexi bacterium]|nr:transcriptional regulator [Chloroflexota bacterium]